MHRGGKDRSDSGGGQADAKLHGGCSIRRLSTQFPHHTARCPRYHRRSTPKKPHRSDADHHRCGCANSVSTPVSPPVFTPLCTALATLDRMPKHITENAQPAAHLISHARQLLATRTHHATVHDWVATLGINSAEALIDTHAAQHRSGPITRLLIAEHRNRNHLATTLLLARCARWIAKVSRYAQGDSIDERFNTTIDAFLTTAAHKAPLNHPYLSQQLYWITLRTVTNAKRSHTHTAAALSVTIDIPANLNNEYGIEHYLTADALLTWAATQKIITDTERDILALRYTGDETMTVRDIASAINATEHAIESKIRRTLARIRKAIHNTPTDFEQFCRTTAIDSATKKEESKQEDGLSWIKTNDIRAA